MRIRDSGIGVGGPGGRAVCCLFAVLLLLATGAVRGDQRGWLELVSHSHTFMFAPGNAASYPVAISANGRYVAFYSYATDLIDGGSDTNGTADAFLWDGDTRTVTLISHQAGSATTTGNSGSYPVAMSWDGRYVAFGSQATDLIAGGTDTNGSPDAFLWDRVTGEVSLISHTASSSKVAANGYSMPTAIDKDGRYVTFFSTGGNLISGQITAAGEHAFVWDRVSEEVRLVSHVPGSDKRTGNKRSVPSAISPDGLYVTFLSAATDLIAGGVDTNDREDAFLFVASSGEVRLVSHVPGAPKTAGNGLSIPLAISGEGRYVLFYSEAANLIGGGGHTHPAADALLWDKDTDTTTLISHKATSASTAGNGRSYPIGMSGDGRYVAYESKATDLIAGGVDTNLAEDVFLWDRDTPDVRLVSHVPGQPSRAGSGRSRPTAIRRDGALVAFESTATDLIAGGTDLNHSDDAFLWERGTGEVRLISHVQQSPLVTSNGRSTPVAISMQGIRVAVLSNATNLFTWFPMNGMEQAFRYELGLLSDGFESGSFWAWSGVFGGG